MLRWLALQNARLTTIGDGIDNDCDGVIDEELANGVDDDLDGRIDEDTAYSEAFCLFCGDGTCSSTESCASCAQGLKIFFKKNDSIQKIVEVVANTVQPHFLPLGIALTKEEDIIKLYRIPQVLVLIQ